MPLDAAAAIARRILPCTFYLHCFHVILYCCPLFVMPDYRWRPYATRLAHRFRFVAFAATLRYDGRRHI